MNDEQVKSDHSTEGSSNSRRPKSRSQSNGNACIWLDCVKRTYILLLSFAAIAFSIMVVFSCEFFSYRTLDGQPWEGLVSPFDSLTSASVGLFSFSATSNATDAIQLSILNGECVEYENPWETGQSHFWIVAQWCSIAAPVAGFLAWAQLILEMIFCRLRCSFLLITLLLLAASGLQGCTYLIIADREFW